ncbi:aldehyde dehydrogenase family protein [Roseicitreum antarcticum]|uniref:Acyl-CoA reductase n=1 Tax=Roseicitreum antarcticum TaxID=564137 RepID=A0A1H2YK25_9RHOB|nr:aldehyde dehydrogenase family protein [Roseicitreum antarcticum]SDX05612.1 Acyl-CoA reductase [Roseicitreum antarcticum]
MQHSTGAGRLQLPEKPREYAALIDGRFIPARDRELIGRDNPAHNHPVSLYPKATPEDLRDALSAARRTVDNRVWSGMSSADRARILLKVAALIDTHRVELREIECLEVGKPIGLVDREIGGAVAHWEYAATMARHSYGDTYDTFGNDALGLVMRNPVGVVSMITPWNYPLMINSQKLPFALAVGCSAVVKPSELTSGSALRLGELLMEAGIPAGVVNIIAGTGLDLGEGLCTAPEVDMVSFTGSTAVGRKIAAQAGEKLKKISLELGGKSAQIVCADADLELAAEKVALGATRNAGQACVGGTRLIVERSIADSFCAAVQAHVERLRIGDPLDPETTMGPLISAVQKTRVEGYIKEGERDGANRWTMETSHAKTLPGHFVQPTIFTEVRNDMSIAQDEIFGPVLTVTTFDAVSDAIDIANNSRYGLAAGVWSTNINKALQMGRRLDAGSIEVNTFLAGVPELPIVGHRDSGVGSERGRNAVQEFTELKTIQVQLSPV